SLSLVLLACVCLSLSLDCKFREGRTVSYSLLFLSYLSEPGNGSFSCPRSAVVLKHMILLLTRCQKARSCLMVHRDGWSFTSLHLI
uniref:Uncharacterized protein n=1 Tax=Mustela putorius furo TaxID=9669 RepID=M3XSX6_MUSPF